MASNISCFMYDKLKKGELSLYEAYTLKREILNLERKAYTRVSWKQNTGIRECIAFINPIMLAVLFDETEYCEKLKEMAWEAFRLNKEKRSHYVMDNFEIYIDAANNEELLKEISDTRARYNVALEKELAGKKLTKAEAKEFDYDNGPFLTETFPNDFFEPENLLLSKETFKADKTLSEDVVDIIVQVGIKW